MRRVISSPVQYMYLHGQNQQLRISTWRTSLGQCFSSWLSAKPEEMGTLAVTKTMKLLKVLCVIFTARHYFSHDNYHFGEIVWRITHTELQTSGKGLTFRMHYLVAQQQNRFHVFLLLYYNAVTKSKDTLKIWSIILKRLKFSLLFYLTEGGPKKVQFNINQIRHG